MHLAGALVTAVLQSIAESAQDHMCFEDLRPEDAENLVEQVTGERK